MCIKEKLIYGRNTYGIEQPIERTNQCARDNFLEKYKEIEGIKVF